MIIADADKGQQFFSVGNGYGANMGFFNNDLRNFSATLLIEASG